MSLGTFGKLLIVFSTKVNLQYLLCSMAWSCYLLHLIKHCYLLKTFLRTLILITQVSLYPFSHLELIWNCIIAELLYQIHIWRSLVFHIVGRSHQWTLYLTMLGKGLQLKTRSLFCLWFPIWFWVFQINCRSSDSCIW